MLTAEQVQSIMPRLSATRTSELLPFLTSAMAEFLIEAPARAAAFLAQLAHESGQFRFMEEIWGPTEAQRRYEPVTACRSALATSTG
jgi:putative chitinase